MQVVLIRGKQGSGKTTTQQMLKVLYESRFGKKVTVVNFADILYEMHNAVLGILDRYWPKRDIVKDGALLQMLGTDWARKSIDQDIWVKCLQKKISEAPDGLVIIGDCRFENEFDGFPEALRVSLECPEEERKKRCSQWRENTNHQSETGLDKYAADGLFDLYIHTDKTPAAGAVELISAQLSKNVWTEKRVDPASKKARSFFDNIAADFTEALRSVEDHTGYQANFRWLYDPLTGRKSLTLADVGVARKPDALAVAKAQAEVPDIMKRAEELVGKPVEVKPNEQPSV